jgi:histidinol-phosphate/aromatic aminotransferase/cobyric acid decarboxylase-like protein
LAESRQRTRVARETIYQILQRHKLPFVRSDCNFVSFQVPEEGTSFIAKVETHGVSLKAVALAGSDHWARVGCGAPAELAAFDVALGKTLA